MESPHGAGALEREGDIKKSDWYPDLWLLSGDALQEAGFTRNSMQESLSDEFPLDQYARLAQRLGRLPVEGALIRESKANSSFPDWGTFRSHFGGQGKLLGSVAAFCTARAGFDDVLASCESAVKLQNKAPDLQDKRC